MLQDKKIKSSAKLQQNKEWNIQSWTKVLGHFCISGTFFNSHSPNPSPHPTNNVGRVYPDFFFQVSTLYRVGGGRTTRKFRKGCTVLRQNWELWQKNMNIAVLSQGLLSRIVAWCQGHSEIRYISRGCSHYPGLSPYLLLSTREGGCCGLYVVVCYKENFDNSLW